MVVKEVKIYCQLHNRRKTRFNIINPLKFNVAIATSHIILLLL